MTANLPAERRPQVVAGGKVAALVPHSLEEAFRVSQAIAASGLAPRGIDKPEQILVAIMAGAEVGLAPFQALQSIAVINGKPTLWGDGLIAVVRSHGFKVKEWFDNEDAPTKAFCEVTRPDSGEVIQRTFSLDDAKKANLLGKTGPWQTNQKRMLQMRARGFACRDGAADVLRGFQLREEVEDYPATARNGAGAEATGMRARLEARQRVGGFDPDHVSRELDDAAAGAIEAEFTEPETFTAEETAAAAEMRQEPADEPFPGDVAAKPTKAATDRPSLPEGMKTGRQVLEEQRAGEALEDIGRRQELWDRITADLDESRTLEAAEDVWSRAESFRDWLTARAPNRFDALTAKYDAIVEWLG